MSFLDYTTSIASIVTLLKAIEKEAANSKPVTTTEDDISYINKAVIIANYTNAKNIKYGFLFKPQSGTLSVIKP